MDTGARTAPGPPKINYLDGSSRTCAVAKLCIDRATKSIEVSRHVILIIIWSLVCSHYKKSKFRQHSFNDDLYPNPSKMFKWFKNKGLRNGANLHDADGIRSYREPFILGFFSACLCIARLYR